MYIVQYQGQLANFASKEKQDVAVASNIQVWSFDHEIRGTGIGNSMFLPDLLRGILRALKCTPMVARADSVQVDYKKRG